MGTPAGFEELFASQTPALFRRALLLCHDWHLAEDLIQETALTALKKWRKVSGADDPAAYLQTILTNAFLSRTRKRGFHESPVEIVVPQSVDPWPSIDLEIETAESLAKLTPDERAVVVGRYLDDRSAAEVAASLGRKESWVRVTAHRALLKIRDDISPPAPKTESETVTGEIAVTHAPRRLV